MAAAWKTDAREGGGGRFVKFKAGTEVDMKVISGPEPHQFTASDGKKVSGWEWEVETEDGPRTLSVTSRRLLQVLADEDDECPLEGTWIRIKALGDGMERQWRVRRIERHKTTQREMVEKDEEEDNGPAVKARRPEPVEEDVAEAPRSRQNTRRSRDNDENVVECNSVDEFEEQAKKRRRK